MALLTALASLLGFSEGGKTGKAETPTGQGKQTGGKVYGEPGIDKIPARLTLGEWVINARAARYYGDAFLDAINKMRFPRIDTRSGSIIGYAAQTHYQYGGPVAVTEGNRGGDIVIANVLSAEDIYRVMGDAHKGSTVILNHIGAAIEKNHPVIRRLRSK